MKEELVWGFILYCWQSFVRTSVSVNQYQSQCCQTIAVTSQEPHLTGQYVFKEVMRGLPEFCVGDCVYKKVAGISAGQEFCFYESELEGDVNSECLLQTPTSSSIPVTTSVSSASTSTGSSAGTRSTSRSSSPSLFTSSNPQNSSQGTSQTSTTFLTNGNVFKYGTE